MSLEIEIAKIWIDEKEVGENLKGHRLKEGDRIVLCADTGDCIIQPDDPSMN